MSTFCPKDFPTCSKICLPLHPSVFSLGPSNTVKIISQIGGSEVRLHNPKNDTIRLFTMFGGTDDNSSYLPPISPFPRCYPSRSFHIYLPDLLPFFRIMATWGSKPQSSYSRSPLFWKLSLFFCRVCQSVDSYNHSRNRLLTGSLLSWLAKYSGVLLWIRRAWWSETVRWLLTPSYIIRVTWRLYFCSACSPCTHSLLRVALNEYVDRTSCGRFCAISALNATVAKVANTEASEP